MVINIDTFGINSQIYPNPMHHWDAVTFQHLYAYRQALTDFNPDWFIDYNSTEPADIQIAYMLQPDSLPTNGKEYDIIIMGNCVEPLNINSQAMIDHWQNDNVYFMTNSYLSPDHTLSGKVIWNPTCLLRCRNMWTNNLYAHTFINRSNSELQRKNTMFAITGKNRLQRHYIFDLIAKTIPISVHNKMHTLKSDVADHDYNPWADEYDERFLADLRELYKEELAAQPAPETDNTYIYNSKMKSNGIGGILGVTPLGNEIMPEYYTNLVIVYPETNIENNEMILTEKSCKCFFSKSIPWPIGGANINKLFNEAGFKTAWNLLPLHLQKYDSELDHMKRIHLMVEATTWFYENIDNIANSSEYKELVETNFYNYIMGKAETKTVEQLANIITQHLGNRDDG